MLAGGLLAAALVGCTELDQLKARNHQLDSELMAAQGRVSALEAEKAGWDAALSDKDAAAKAAQLEAEMWKNKYQAGAGAAGKGMGVTPELEEQLRRLALLDSSFRVKQTQEGLVVEVGADILFDSGKSELKPAGRTTIKRITDVIKAHGTDETLRVDGHTDNEPIKRSGWKDNWDLSAARARTVLTTMAAEGIAPERMYLAGFALYRPQATNDTPQGRQQNRRVEILIVPKLQLSTLTPQPRSSAPPPQLSAPQ
jgi:flagellar motor protein MotB